jgi:hypothetical protein
MTPVVDGVEWPALEVVVLSFDPAADLRRYAVAGLAAPRPLRPPAQAHPPDQPRLGSPG